MIGSGLEEEGMSYSAKVISGGKIVIPAELRRELGIKDGDTLVIERDDKGAFVLKSYFQVVREVQAEFRALVGDDYSVDQFLAERKAMWGEEN
jgi:AbrB family transcriptional regulator (stage V sporulation protein T)